MTAATVRIEPDGIYDDDTLYAALGLSAQTLARSRRDGSLRYARKGNRTLYMGRWVLAWLTAGVDDLPGAKDGVPA
jgi:hypothetical protein